MSSEDAGAMSEENMSALVPRRRFPEFREAVEWQEVSLSTQVDLISGLHLAPDEYAESGEVPYFTGPSDYSNEWASVSKWTARGANSGRTGDTLVTVKGNGVGELLYLLLDEVAIGRQLMAVRPRTAHGEFIFHFLTTQRQRLTALASGNLIPGLSRGDILGLKVFVPESDEQQKIADCLSSLDELITAETQKLYALKTYKKGLMQQLFPREGETVPQLRLPEFRAAGEWQKKKVSDLLTRSVRPVDVNVEATYQEIGIRSHGKGIFHKEPMPGKALGDKRVFWVEEDSFVANIVFAWEQAVAVTSAAEKGMIASHRFPMYKAKKGKSDVDFIRCFFLTKKGKELLAIASPGGAGRNKTLGQRDFENLEFLSPKHVEEQVEIARCLSSIDDLIAAQGQEIDALKAHKKGLMQQLFPVLDEVFT